MIPTSLCLYFLHSLAALCQDFETQAMQSPGRNQNYKVLLAGLYLSDTMVWSHKFLHAPLPAACWKALEYGGVWADEVGALFMQLLEGCAWVELLGDATVLESPKRQ